MYCISRISVNTTRIVKIEGNLVLVIGVILYKVSNWGGSREDVGDVGSKAIIYVGF